MSDTEAQRSILHDSNGEPTEKTDGSGESDDDSEPAVAYYQCPHCDFADDGPESIRRHITQKDDPRHRGRNGFEPTENVLAVDDTGEVVEARAGGIESLTTLPPGEITTDLLPDSTGGEIEQTILMKALTNPTASVNEIYEAVCNAGHDVSYTKVYTCVKDAVGVSNRPDGRTKRAKQKAAKQRVADAEAAGGNDGGAPTERTLDDLTEKQRAAVLSYASDPVRGWDEIAADAGVSDAYPPMVLKKDEIWALAKARWNPPSPEETRLMLAADNSYQGEEPPEPGSLTYANGKPVLYDWPSDEDGNVPPYRDLPFHHRAVVDYLVANQGAEWGEVADALQYPEGYVTLLAGRYSDLIETLVQEAKTGERIVKRQNGSAAYRGQAGGGIDATMSYLDETAPVSEAHVRRMDDLETLPDPPTTETDEDEDGAEDDAEDGAKSDDGGQEAEEEDAAEPAAAAGREDRDTDEADAPAPIDADEVSETLLDDLRDKRTFVKAGAERDEGYAMGMYDALTYAIDAIESDADAEKSDDGGE